MHQAKDRTLLISVTVGIKVVLAIPRKRMKYVHRTTPKIIAKLQMLFLLDSQNMICSFLKKAPICLLQPKVPLLFAF